MKKIFFGFIALIFFLNFVFAGYYLEQNVVTNQGENSKAFVQKMWIQGNFTRVDTDRAIIIVDFQNQKSVMADMVKKTYFEMSFQQLSAMTNMVFQMMKKMNMDITPNIQITDQTKKIGKYTCRVIYVTMGNFQKTEECLSKDINIDFSIYLKFVEVLFPKDLYEKMEAQSETLSKIGFPVYSKTTSTIMGRSSVTESTLSSYKKVSIPSSIFKVPEGYTKKAPPSMNMPQH